MKGKKNYFEDIKNYRIEDKFIEHLIRLLFFTIVIGIGSIYQRFKHLLFHIKNFLLSRSMSDVLAKYAKYKESVNSLMGKTAYHKKLHLHIHGVINSHFSEYERRMVFGLKNSRESIVNSSRQIISTVKGYTKSMGARYFAHIPETGLTKKITSALISIQLPGRSCLNRKEIKSGCDITGKIKYLNHVAMGYRNYMHEKFEKFYNEDFRKKLSSPSANMKTVRDNIERITTTVRRIEQRQIRYRLGESSG